MNNVDKQYLDILRDIIDNGTEKNTRSGKVLSVFGRMMHFNLKEGLPILTTKKVFTKGVIHELLWFLSGDTNIKYLVENNVHIWDADAYRHYCNLTKTHNKICEKYTTLSPLPTVDNEEFIECVKKEYTERFYMENVDGEVIVSDYQFGDLGNVYGAQWRKYGVSSFDQIQHIIDTLKTNPDDRRMLCVAYNPDAIADYGGLALPPCHILFQFYTRELELDERIAWLRENSTENTSNVIDDEQLDSLGVPRRELSCMWSQRSVDEFLGFPFNLLSYSILTHMIAQVCGMSVGELVCSLGDCHIYMEHLDAVREQLNNDPYKYDLPKLVLNPNVKNIDDFTFDDIKIEDYQSYPTIKAKLLVG